MRHHVKIGHSILVRTGSDRTGKFATHATLNINGVNLMFRVESYILGRKHENTTRHIKGGCLADMSDFFAGVTGFKFPDTLWDKGPLPSVVGGPAGSDDTPDGVWWNDILHAPRYLLVVVSEPMRALSPLAYGVIFTNRLQRNSSSRVSMSTRATSQCLTRWTRETSCFSCTRRIGRGSPRTRLQTHCHMLPYVPWLSCVLEISISSITSLSVFSTLTV